MSKIKINYSVLKKTADNKGVMYCTANGENYLFNSFCIVKGLDDMQFAIAIEKTSACEVQVQNHLPVDYFNKCISDEMAKGVAYTYISKNSKQGSTIEFFKIQNKNRDIVLVDSKFLQIIKKEKLASIKGVDDKSPLCFELSNGVKVLILPIVSTDSYIDKIKNFLKIIDSFY